MRKRLLVVGLLVVGVALLSGCAAFQQLIDQITGGGTGGGTTTSAYPISGRMKISLAATVWRDDGYTGEHTYDGVIATTFWSGAGYYYEDSRLFRADIWTGGNFYNTWFDATLSADGKSITSFSASQIQTNAFMGYTYSHRIDGVNVPFSHLDGNSRYYRIEGTAARSHVTALEYYATVPSSAGPGDWITGGPAALTGDVGDYIEIRLDYQNAAVAP